MIAVIILLSLTFLSLPQASAQTITIEPVESSVTRGTTGTTQSVKIKRSGDTSKQSTVNFSSVGSGTSPALSTDFIAGFPSGTVTFAGDVTPTDDPDCLVAAPAPAAAFGFTKLDFCDGFAYDSIARGPDAAGRRIGGKKKWTIERSAVFGGTEVNPASDFTHSPSTGEMLFALTANKYQSAIQTVNGKQDPLNGYWISNTEGWYVEIKLMMTTQAATSQFAFWSMDMCHWSGGPDKCSTRSPANAYLEPDWLEYPFGQTALHRHKEGDTSYHLQCYNSQSGGDLAIPLNVYKIHGVRVEPPASGGAMRRFVNNVEKSTALTPGGKCANLGPVWAQLVTSGKYPLLLGARVGDKFKVDYIRVWVKP